MHIRPDASAAEIVLTSKPEVRLESGVIDLPPRTVAILAPKDR